MVVYQAAEPAWWDATARAHLPASEQKRAQALADALKLRAAALDTDLELLSTGERQRLALIRSLACRPRVLLLDEPASALDAASTAALEALLRSELERGTSVLVVTHSEEQAERLGQRCLPPGRLGQLPYRGRSGSAVEPGHGGAGPDDGHPPHALARPALCHPVDGHRAGQRAKFGKPHPGHQPDVRGGYHHAAGHHDRPAPRRHGSARRRRIPDPVAVPAGREQRTGRRRRGLAGQPRTWRRPRQAA
nr:hypothetical protein [Tanacetum cinerariifolium]